MVRKELITIKLEEGNTYNKNNKHYLVIRKKGNVLASKCIDANLLSVDEVLKVVLPIIDMPYDTLILKSRKWSITKNRGIAMYFLREYTNANLETIGELFGLAHCSVIHSINVIKSELLRDVSLQGIVAEASEQLNKLVKSNL